jgi:primary-amine oxidase
MMEQGPTFKKAVASSNVSITDAIKHPLASLNENEMKIVVSCVQKYYSSLYTNDTVASSTTTNNFIRFCGISIKEPTKESLQKYYSNPKSVVVPRQAEVIVMNSETGLGSEIIVEVCRDTEKCLRTNEHVNSSVVMDELRAAVVNVVVLPPGVQPMLTPDDCDLAEQIVYNSKEVADILKERYNITDMTKVACDPWCIHVASQAEIDLVATPNSKGKPNRLVQNFLYYRPVGVGYECNQNAHPIDIIPIIDLNEQCLVCIHGLDRLPPPAIPSTPVNFHRNLIQTNEYLEQSFRTDKLKPLHILQPDGPSFTISNQDGIDTINWQKWSIQIGFNYREGIVLYNIMFNNRSICSRASLVEMAVPYGDINAPFHTKCAFDVGDYGLGYCANNLQLGCDCLGHIHYIHSNVVNSKGEVIHKPNVICIHEIDNGVLWKHVEYRNNYNESRRSRELIISSIATVVNYEYLFYWKFKLDGTIDFEIQLTGELSTNVLSINEISDEGNQDDNVVEEGTSAASTLSQTKTRKYKPQYGVIVAPDVNSQYHQHIFCVRLDMCVDGTSNTVSEVDIVRVPYDAKTNPYGNAFTVKETVLDTEHNAKRICDATVGRCWKISSSHNKNCINHKPTSYKLVPYTYGPCQPTLLADPDNSFLAKKGTFATANLWVTQYNDTERFPSGNYTPQQVGLADGLPVWIEQNRNLVNHDVVLWHAFGTCHIPRIEDFPVRHMT